MFPGADASLPLAWVCEQWERAGFEVMRVENHGVHYGLTIEKWWYNWSRNKAKVEAKYGRWWWKNWAVFLAWSAIIARQGTSTVYFMVLSKNNMCDKSTRTGANVDRIGTWVNQSASGNLTERNNK